MSSEKKIKGKYLYSPQCGLLENFLVTFDEGVIKSVSSSNSAGDSVDYDIGNSILLPGFINSHCHLELTGFRNLLNRNSSFSRWVEDIIRLKLKTPQEDFEQFVETGIVEGIKGGCTFFADISGSFTSASALERTGARGMVFYEAIGYGKKDSARVFGQLKETIKIHKERNYRNILPAISPHAVYSVSKEIFKKCSDFSVTEKLPVQIHCAETKEECDFLQFGEGPFFSLLSFFGQIDENWQAEGKSPVEFLKELGLLKENNTLVHLNFYSAKDLDIVADSGISVVVCPLSNNYWFGRETSPVEDCFYKGINLAVGTDSCASNDAINMFDELRHLRKIYPSLSSEDLIASATVKGALAFGMEEKLGIIAPAFCADMISVPLDFESGGQRVLDGLIDYAKEVNLSIIAGKEVYSCL